MAGRYWSRYSSSFCFSGVMISIKLIDVHICHDRGLGDWFSKRSRIGLHRVSDAAFMLYSIRALVRVGGGSPMSHLDFKKWQWRIALLLIFLNVRCRISEMTLSHVTSCLAMPPCRMSPSPMSHVEFQKCPCHPVDFRGQEP